MNKFEKIAWKLDNKNDGEWYALVRCPKVKFSKELAYDLKAICGLSPQFELIKIMDMELEIRDQAPLNEQEIEDMFDLAGW